MVPPTLNILLWTFSLFSCLMISQCQVSSHNFRTSTIVQPPFGFYGPGLTPVSSFPNMQDCQMNSDFLNPIKIEATNKGIELCSSRFVPCQDAVFSKFRTMDGSCNNLIHPSWGMQDQCYRRILPFDYADNISRPRISCTGNSLPNPRHVANVFHKERRLFYDKQTTHFVEWGQMVNHDITLNDAFRTPESGHNLPIDCCKNGPVINDQCFSVAVPPNDPFYTKRGVTCINFARTIPCERCNKGQRVHWNQNTAYMDLSLTYGSTKQHAEELRSKSRGMLKVEYNPDSGPMLPTVHMEENCISPPQKKSCYHAGDQRSNQNLFLLASHTFLLRHHNFICQELHKINPHWDDERIYQEARRINIAIVQFITYEHYLPLVLGEIMEKNGINVLPGAKYTNYDPEVDAGVIDEYTGYAARYGHTIVPGLISEIDPDTEETDVIRLRDYFYTPFGFRFGQYDKICKGMTVDRRMRHDRVVSDDLRQYLYRRLYLNETTGLDLSAGAIIRGRDHGLPGYTYYLKHFSGTTVQSFDDLRKVMTRQDAELLKGLYESVHDIDVYTGGIAEYYEPGAIVGITFGAVVGEQFRRLKFGDRYYFEHGNEAGSFPPEQLLEIKRSSLSRILCETTRITEIQREAFEPPSSENPVVPCEEIHRFNFRLWKE